MGLPAHEILITQEQISERINDLATEISTSLRDENPMIIVILKGAFMFAADLFKKFDFPFELDFIAISSYGDETETSGAVKLQKDLDKPIEGRTVLIIEDIVDTGLTIHYLRQMLEIRKPKAIKVAAFLSKNARREFETDIDYIGFEVPNKFVVGYGLDFRQNWRGLPYIINILQ